MDITSKKVYRFTKEDIAGLIRLYCQNNNLDVNNDMEFEFKVTTPLHGEQPQFTGCDVTLYDNTEDVDIDNSKSDGNKADIIGINSFKYF